MTAVRAFLGIDCGTQSTKAVVVDAESGSVLAVGRYAHDLISRPDGTREQRPEWWIEALTLAARSALAAAGDHEIVGIGVAGQQHGLVSLDSADRTVRPAKLWNDTTTSPQCDDLTNRLGGTQALLELTGNLMLPGYTAPKIEWLRRHEPGSYAVATRFCLPHDYLNLWLTGRFATEPGDASGTAYFDVRRRRYSEPILAAIDGARDWTRTLPEVIPSLSVLGALRAEAATALGLPAGIPVSAGGGDNMCSAIAVGATEPGPVVISLGTSGTAFGYMSQPAVDPLGEAAAFCDSTGGWLPLACTLNCGLVLDWVTELVGIAQQGVEVAISGTMPGSAGLVCVPYLAGERTPNRPDASARFIGVRPQHSGEHFVRAAVEGVTFGLQYALGGLERAGVAPRAVTLIGGGARSDAWAQLCADVFEVPVTRTAAVEAAALGAALQARWAIAELSPPQPQSDRTFAPHPSDALRRGLASFRELIRTDN